MQVTKLSGERLDLALDRFLGGDHLNMQEASFVLLDDSSVQCNIQSSWKPANLDREKAKKDFVEAEKTFNYLRENSTKFNGLVRNRNLEISLIDDYGMGAIELAHFKNGEID
ncbi:hypothetical protein [Rhodohalobacter sp. 8-1]|uniref:hypothetical protein n=1 Tax=Rhodohalobacter sp. 8-1 TaxID=3131972 RepID=UPI0030EB1B81